jgi:hypothetical protein
VPAKATSFGSEVFALLSRMTSNLCDNNYLRNISSLDVAIPPSPSHDPRIVRREANDADAQYQIHGVRRSNDHP